MNSPAAAAARALLEHKAPGDRVLLSDLRGVPGYHRAKSRELRELAQSLASSGLIDWYAGEYYRAGRKPSAGEYAPPWQPHPHENGVIGPRDAYTFFDAHERIFRGRILASEGYDLRWEKARIIVLNEWEQQYGFIDSAVRAGRYAVPGAEARHWTLGQLVGKLEEGDFALVRKVAEFSDRRGKQVFVFGPLTEISRRDGLTKNGRTLATRFDDERIYDFPLVACDGERGFGYLHSVGMVTVNDIWGTGIVVPEARIVGRTIDGVVADVRA